MASTIQLARSVNLASQFLYNAPLSFGTGTNNDPALSNADWVRQFLLSPPFAWRWNRASVDVLCTIGATDYQTALPTFGWVEKAVLIDTSGGGAGTTTELEVSTDLAQEYSPNQPTKLSAQIDDGAGNITFRLLPAPDKPYTVRITFQKAPLTFAALTDTWTPVPDYLSYLYNSGFIAKCAEYRGDARFVPEMQAFLQAVVAANQSLNATQADIFLTDRMNTLREQQALQSGRF